MFGLLIFEHLKMAEHVLSKMMFGLFSIWTIVLEVDVQTFFARTLVRPLNILNFFSSLSMFKKNSFWTSIFEHDVQNLMFKLLFESTKTFFLNSFSDPWLILISTESFYTSKNHVEIQKYKQKQNHFFTDCL